MSAKCDKSAEMCEYSNSWSGICEHEQNGDCALLLMGAEDDECGYAVCKCCFGNGVIQEEGYMEGIYG